MLGKTLGVLGDAMWVLVAGTPHCGFGGGGCGVCPWLVLGVPSGCWDPLWVLRSTVGAEGVSSGCWESLVGGECPWWVLGGCLWWVLGSPTGAHPTAISRQPQGPGVGELEAPAREQLLQQAAQCLSKLVQVAPRTKRNFILDQVTPPSKNPTAHPEYHQPPPNLNDPQDNLSNPQKP